MNELILQFNQFKQSFVDSIETAEIDETISKYRIYSTSIQSDEEVELLKNFGELLVQDSLGTLLIEGEIIGEVSLTELTLDRVVNEEIRIIIDKERNDFIYFFSLQGFGQFLWQENDLKKYPLVYINEDLKSFSTYTNHFKSLQTRDDNCQIEEFDFNGLTDPRVLVRDRTTSLKVLPTNVSSWFLVNFKEENKVLLEWKKIASFKLSLTLPLQIISDEEFHVVFKDENYYSFRLKNKENADFVNEYTDIKKASYWIYKNKEEAESKHRLLNHQLAVEWSEEIMFPEGNKIARSLSNAKRAYDLHLHDSSKEVLKSLTELRKNLFEEVERVKETTRSLSDKLWRDFAIALGVVVIKFVPNFSSISDEHLNILAYGTALFLIVSIAITVASNFFFNRSSKQNRKKWQERLFFYISKNEFDEIYESHIKNSLWTFRGVQTAVFLVYVVLSATLFLIAFCDL